MLIKEIKEEIDFKLIAIKTGTISKASTNFRIGNDSKAEIDYLKNLNTDTIYNFYNHYIFINNNFDNIVYVPEQEVNLYSIKLTENREIPVNISAIVGENGSGKSTLIELIYWINYNLGCKFNLLEYENDDGDFDKYQINNSLDLQLLYSINRSELFVLKLENGDIKQRKITLIDKHFVGEEPYEWIIISSINDLSNFFYSLVINYSQYALNALEVEDWVNPLFHKNDGYQTPLVLNPKRDNGNIDVNKENKLLGRRLQANLLEIIDLGNEKESRRNLTNDKLAISLKLVFNPIEKMEVFSHLDKENDIKNAIEKYFDFKFNQIEIPKKYLTVSSRYIYDKLVKISQNYKPFKRFKDGETFGDIDGFFEEIIDSDSHIVFKLKGVILYLKYFKEIFVDSNIDFEKPIVLSIEKLSKLIKRIKDSEQKSFLVNTFMMAPPSFFKTEILIEGGISLNSLSSGEKQRIFSLSSIIYHLVNLNSVEEQKLSKGEIFTSYNYINLILDEIELYYHPEWQRKYIAELLFYVSKVNPDNLKNIKGINIMFITHSPFILSDIPNQYILRLKDGNPKPYEINEQTFGANIHDMLANEFFMENGYMGQWAKKKIISAIDYLENYIKSIPTGNLFVSGEWNKDSIKVLIDNIGEPLIKNSLYDLYDNAFYLSKEKIHQEIERLTKLL